MTRASSPVVPDREAEASPQSEVSAPRRPRRSIEWPILISYVAVSVLAGLIVGLMFGPDAWYDSLDKSPLNPPGAVFGPVWTVLYVLIGVAAYLAWAADTDRWLRPAMTLWVVQLILNLAWTPIFFGAQSPELALLEIVVLLIAIVATIVVFARRSLAAAAVMVPYALWVAFATYLNAYIVANN
jgi:tryptophan-rich sensory protein